MSHHSPEGAAPLQAGQFPSTHWSIVVTARDRASPQARDALAALCRAYWYPLYAYVRRQVGSDDRALDLTQEFFARLLEKDFLSTVDREKGQFRAFLLACCKHFLANVRDHEGAQKRGGGVAPLSLDLGSAVERYRREPTHELTAEKLFERRWALTLLDTALERLSEEHRQDGKSELYEHLKVALLGAYEALSYAQIGSALGMSEAAVKKAAQRLRQRYREVLREQVAATVQGPDEVEDEIRALFAVLAS